MISTRVVYIALSILSVFASRSARADDNYDIGTPTLRDIWVDPAHGTDGPSRGSTRALALKTVRYAWAFLPQNQTLTNTGYRILIAPGSFSPDDVPSQFQSVWGTADFPVIIQASDDSGSVIFPSVDVAVCYYFYMIGIRVTASQSSYVSTFRSCDHLLLRSCQFFASDSTTADTAVYGASIYQCQHTYIERCELARPTGDAVNIFASQYGHIKQSYLHNFGGNGVFLSAGTAYFSIEENTIRYAGGGGIVCSTHDTSNGLDNMVMPWVHYDTYDVKSFNNIIDHTLSAGFSCCGGYNILFAHNTLYQTGLNNSLITLNLARRACSIDKQTCQQRLDSGAWGTVYYDFADSDSAPIPNKNIFIYNNIFSNTADSATASSHFSIAGPVTKIAVNAACPKPAYADDNLEIKGNIIWNGKPDKDLGITASSGCGPNNPSCNQIQLGTDNLINAAEPDFINAASGDFHPTPGSVVFTIAKTFPIPDFSWSGLPPSPQEPIGNTSNSIPFDRDSNRRDLSKPVSGAFIISISSVSTEINTQSEISLLQNYPNPSHGKTTISFNLRDRAPVTLEIYDLLGEKISSLISQTLDKGDHSIDWNMTKLQSGKYFCRLQAGSMTVTKQLTVIK